MINCTYEFERCVENMSINIGVSVRLIPIDEQGLSRHDEIVQMTAESR